MRLSNICTTKSGFQGKTLEGYTHKIIKLKDVTRDGVIKLDELENFTVDKMNEKYLLKKGDIIIKAKSGDNTAALINEDLANVVAAAHFIIITVTDKNITPEYLVAYLNSEYAQNYFKKHAQGTALPIITIKTLDELVVKVLSLDKQQKVANMYKLIKEEKMIMEEIIDNREKQFKAYLRDIIK